MGKLNPHNPNFEAVFDAKQKMMRKARENATVLRRIVEMMQAEEEWESVVLTDISVLLIDHGYATMDDDGNFKSTGRLD